MTAPSTMRWWRLWVVGTTIIALGTAACGGSADPTHASDRATSRADAQRATRLIAGALVSHLHSRVAVEGGSYQPCTTGRSQSFYSDSLTVVAQAGTTVGQFDSLIIPELRKLGWVVTVVDVAKLHALGGPVRHPIDRIRDGALFGAVNVLEIAKKTETIVFVNTACFTTGGTA